MIHFEHDVAILFPFQEPSLETPFVTQLQDVAEDLAALLVFPSPSHSVLSPDPFSFHTHFEEGSHVVQASLELTV